MEWRVPAEKAAMVPREPMVRAGRRGTEQVPSSAASGRLGLAAPDGPAAMDPEEEEEAAGGLSRSAPAPPVTARSRIPAAGAARVAEEVAAASVVPAVTEEARPLRCCWRTLAF